MGKASGNGNVVRGLKMTNFYSKHVALLKNKKDCADVYCVTLIELQHIVMPSLRIIFENLIVNLQRPVLPYQHHRGLYKCNKP